MNVPTVTDRKRLILKSIAEMLIRKNEAYGSENIIMTGVPGIIVRMVDKTYRLNNLVTTDSRNYYESMADTMYDIVGYSIIGIALMNGRWGKSSSLLKAYLDQLVEEIPIHPSPPSASYGMTWVGGRSVDIINTLYRAEQQKHLSESMIGQGQIKSWLYDLINASLIGIELHPLV